MLAKVQKLVRGQYSPVQVLQRINRSPLRYAVKDGLRLLHRTEKKARQAALNDLSAERSPEVEELSRTGFMRNIPIDAGLTDELVTSSLALRGREVGSTHKIFLDKLLDPDLDAGRIDQDSVWVRFAMQPMVLRTVAAYLGEVPYLSYVLLTDSKYVDEKHRISQLWHLDYDDVSMIKLFAYLTDVESIDDGPFTFLPTSYAHAAQAVDRAHLDDEAVFSKVPRGAAMSLTGKAGTSFMLDTSRCPHMGGRIAKGRNRLLYTACYIGSPPMYPDWRNRIAITRDLDKIEKLVLQRA